MWMLDEVLKRLLAGPLDDVVAAAVARHRAGDPHLEPEDPLERMLVFGDRSRLRIHPSAKVHNALFNLSSGDVTVGEHAFFGHSVSILTGTHDIGKFGVERANAIPESGRDIDVGEGAWISSHAIVLGPCAIGAHAVVGAGAVVQEDVAPYAVVGGNPAKVIKVIDREAAG